MKPLRIGLLGIGTVGGGTFDVLTRNAEEISRRAGRPITITHVADKNTALANQVVAGRVTVTDDCAAKVLPIRFPEAENVQQLTRETAVSSLKPDRFTAAVLMSHNYGYDKAILLEMISTNVSYIGLLGPRKRFDRMNAELGGVLDGIEAIHAPIGLDIGAQTPLEIAIAVIAEIQAVFARRNAGFLKSREGFIHDRKEILA